jgi:hypothetical protein
MKAISNAVSIPKGLWAALHPVVLAVVITLMGRSDSCGMAPGFFQPANAISNNDVRMGQTGDRLVLRRTFKPGLRSSGALQIPLHKSGRTNPDTPIEITYQDLLAAYDVKNDLEYYYSDDTEDYEMNIGRSDLVNPQHWEMPDAELEDDDYGEGILPSDTPYWSTFSSSTHCKLYEYEDELYYEYYEINEQRVTLTGAVEYWTEEEEAEADSIDLLITPLPLNIHSSFVSEASERNEDTTYAARGVITPFGFGTLSTADGDLEVLAVLNEYNEKIYSGDDLIDDYSQSILVFISKEGHQLNIWLEEDTGLEGTVPVDWIEYTRIAYNPDAVESGGRHPSEIALFQNFPNPFNPVTTIRYNLKEAGPVSLTVFDPLGKKVAVLSDGEKPAGTYEQEFDGSRLSSGVYYCRLQTGNFKETRKLMLMK